MSTSPSISYSSQAADELYCNFYNISLNWYYVDMGPTSQRGERVCGVSGGGPYYYNNGGTTSVILFVALYLET